MLTIYLWTYDEQEYEWLITFVLRIKLSLTRAFLTIRGLFFWGKAFFSFLLFSLWCKIILNEMIKAAVYTQCQTAWICIECLIEWISRSNNFNWKLHSTFPYDINAFILNSKILFYKADLDMCYRNFVLFSFFWSHELLMFWRS